MNALSNGSGWLDAPEEVGLGFGSGFSTPTLERRSNPSSYVSKLNVKTQCKGQNMKHLL
jgi:hypothetical protein